MARTETARIASHLSGAKPYQERARAALPRLVRQAKAGQPIRYEDSAKELSISGPWRSLVLNYPLGCIGRTLQLLGEDWKQDAPPQLQTIVVRKDTGYPGSGIGGFLDRSVAAFKQRPLNEQLQLIKDEQSRVYEYQRWDDVLRALKLEPDPMTVNLVKNAKGFRDGGESEEHRLLKNYVSDHPQVVGLQFTINETNVECRTSLR